MEQLFEPSDKPELPAGITSIELNSVEAVVLKILTFIATPISKSQAKEIAKSVLGALSQYASVRKGTIDKSVESLEDKGLFHRAPDGYYVDKAVAVRIMPLADDNQTLIREILSYLNRGFYYFYNNIFIHLAILTKDVSLLDEKTHFSKSYSWSDTTDVFTKALMRIGDFSAIMPMLPYFDENQRLLFLETLPFILPYRYFTQLKEIYLDSSMINEPFIQYNYASCAHLLLPVEEVVEIATELRLSPDSLFFSTFLKGDTQAALQQASQFLLDYQEEQQHKRKDLPGIYGLLYGLVLLADGGADNLTAAATFIRNTIKRMPNLQEHEKPFKEFAQIVLDFINHILGKKTTSAAALFYTFKSRTHRHFITAVVSWMGRGFSDTYIDPAAEEKIEFEYRAAGLTGEEDTQEYARKRLAHLREKYNMLPLAEIYRPGETWKSVLTLLESELKQNKGPQNQKTQSQQKRLIWLVDPLQDIQLVCLEQTKQKNGWSKGKERSLTRLVNKMPDFATSEDTAIVACLGKHSFFNEVAVRNPGKLMKTLAAHPEVYTIDEPHLPLQIHIQEARLQIDRNEMGATLKLVPDTPEYQIIKESETSYIYVDWPVSLLRIYRILQEANTTELHIPEKGLPKAKKLIGDLSRIMPVTGNFAESGVSEKKSANLPVLQLTPVGNKLHVQILIEVLEDTDARYVPGVGSKNVLVKSADGKHFNVKRNPAHERERVTDLIERISWLRELDDASEQLILEDEQDILDFLAEVKEQAPAVKLIWPKGERMRVAKVLTPAEFNVGIKKENNWFGLEAEVTVDDEVRMTIQQLLEKSNKGSRKYIQLDDKTYLSLCKDLQKRLAAVGAVAQKKGKKLLVHPLGTAAIETFVEGVKNTKTDKGWNEHLKNLDKLKSYQPSVPDNLQAELRPYQKEGVLWLDRLHNWGVGACLADDMGLGKTLQCIAIMLKYAKNGPALVVAPASVCSNWTKELYRFAPTLRPVELKNQNRQVLLDMLEPYDVLVVSYGILQANPDLLDNRQWNITVLDEAHAIKNAKSMRSKAVMKLQSHFRIITTGTPIQNHLGELWNLFQFINPGMLGSAKQFSEKFLKNGGTDNTHLHKMLNRYIAPFVLRRNKSDVLEDLPEKTEISIQVPLSDEESALYETMRQEAVNQLEQAGDSGGAKHLQILAQITKLRQLSCHPQLLVPESNLPSSKLETLEKLVEELIEANHKALIFSQFTKHLSLIRAMLDEKGIAYEYLDGSTPLKKRELAIDNFQNGKSELFLISLKAGGVGLNLTAADYVIHMDPWWNPAVEDQASDRVHRIGQKRPVTIYRLIAENTIEEKIVKLHHSKRDLADKLLADTDQSAKISADELMALITEQA
jgi:SNF2 family DNA or RNA helicase